MKWQDAYEARPSKNIRGENVFDIFRKGTEDMIWADIPEEELEGFMTEMVKIVEKAASDELETLLTEDYTEYGGLGNQSKGDYES